MSKREETVMLAKPFAERLLNKMTPPYLMQRKINGERCLAFIQEGVVTLMSSQGNIFNTVPHVNKFLMELGLPKGMYDGELYRHGWKLQKIHSVISSVRKDLHPEYLEITYQMFDCSIDNLKQIDRTMYLNSLLLNKVDEKSTVQRVQTYGFNDKNDIPDFIKLFVEEGYEGGVIRSTDNLWEVGRKSNLLKIKPRHQDEYVIIGSLEEVSIHGEPKNSLGAFVCMKGTEKFKVGSGSLLTKANRALLWRERDKLVGKYLVVKYPDLTSRSVPYCPVAIEVK